MYNVLTQYLVLAADNTDHLQSNCSINEQAYDEYICSQIQPGIPPQLLYHALKSGLLGYRLSHNRLCLIYHYLVHQIYTWLYKKKGRAFFCLLNQFSGDYTIC